MNVENHAQCPRCRLLWTLAFGLLVCGIAISHQSFWIDEGGVAYKAALPTLGEFWHKISTEGTADLQQPFHHFFAWAWEKIVGMNEFGLRAGNVPFLVLGLFMIVRSLRGEEVLATSVAAALLCSPFVWFYLNEARPYTVQICASMLVFSALLRLGDQTLAGQSPRGWVAVLGAGAVLMAMSGMLAMLWLGAYLGAALVSTPWARLKKILTTFWLFWAVTLVLLFGMGLFYLWTLKIGARATAAGGTDIRNLLFIPYELLGFSGLGPGRLAIRTGGLSAFKPWIHLLAIHGVLVALVLVQGWREVKVRVSTRTRVFWIVCFLLVAGFILAVGVAVHFRVLGRHCTPVLVPVLFVLALGLHRFWKKGTKWGRFVVVAFLISCVASGCMLRFSERHAKDDYRSAAAWGRAALAQGKVVWWSADVEGAANYRLPIGKEMASTPHAFPVVNEVKGFDQSLPRPDVVIASKPDIYDGAGSLGEYLSVHGYRPITNFVAFTIWAAPN